MNEQEREAFEAWFASQDDDLPDQCWLKSEDGQYVFLETQKPWESWQARAAVSEANSWAADVPDGYKLVLVPDELADDEPDWDECKRQAEEAYGLKVGDQTMPIIIREVRRWIAQKWAAPAPEAAKKNEWRELALKFDGQRMAALSHLRMLLEHGEAHADAARTFLAEPPQAAPAPGAKPEYFGDGPLVDGWELSISKGRSGYGVYAHMTDYPEEGAVFLLGLKLPAPAPAPEAEPVAVPACQFYKTGDQDAPKSILDRNGEVVLSMCKVCGKAEGEIDGQCAKPEAQQPAEIGPSAIFEMADKHWYRRGGVSNFDTVGFAKELLRMRGIGASGEASNA